MRNRLLRISAGLAALAALGLGGAAIASATQGGSPSAKAPVSAKVQKSTADGDTIEQENGADDATEAGTGEKPEVAGEAAEEAGAESASEVPGNDGPGGHADEPANPNADHQFQGQE